MDKEVLHRILRQSRLSIINLFVPIFGFHFLRDDLAVAIPTVIVLALVALTIEKRFLSIAPMRDVASQVYFVLLAAYSVALFELFINQLTFFGKEMMIVVWFASLFIYYYWQDRKSSLV